MMSWEKCGSCEFKIDSSTNARQAIMCTITGEELELKTCIKDVMEDAK